MDELHPFLEPEEVETPARTNGIQEPPCRPKKIAKHRRRRSSQEYLVHGEDPTTGEWMKHKDVPTTVMSDYLSQQIYPSMRARAQTLPTINMISLATKKKDTGFSLFKMLVALSLAIVIYACLNPKNPGADRTTEGRKPDVGTLYICEVTRQSYALPNPLSCIDNTKIAEVHSFNAEVLQ